MPHLEFTRPGEVRGVLTVWSLGEESRPQSPVKAVWLLHSPDGKIPT